jgi:hypothetical protein
LVGVGGRVRHDLTRLQAGLLLQQAGQQIGPFL